MIARWQIEALEAFQSEGWPVVSSYLSVYGKALLPQEVVKHANNLVHEGKLSLAELELSHDARAALEHDLMRIYVFVEHEFERGDCKGLAIFSCSGRDFWQVYPLPRPVHDRIEIGEHPYVRPLLVMMEDYPRYGIVLVDGNSARFFVVHLGEIVEFEEALR